MKKLIFGLLAVATVAAAALPASAQVVVRERHGNVVVRPAYAAPVYRSYHHRHRVVFFDRWGHRHVEWR
ncbi:MAG: hypothetical protein WDN45_02165 [Caulobacteraceae bacterium]